MDSTLSLMRDFDTFARKTNLEASRLATSVVSLESSTSLVYISNEGLLAWIKNKLSAMARKFVIIVNKVVARFSKNREAILKQIKTYEQNPKAKVTLPISPKAIAYSAAIVTATAAAAVAVIKVRKDPNAKEKIKKIWDGIKAKIQEAKGKLKKNKTECTAGEAAEALNKQAVAQEQAAKAAKASSAEMSKNTEGKKKEDVQNSASAAQAAMDLLKECNDTTAASMARGDKADANAEENANNKAKAENDSGVQNALKKIKGCIKDVGAIYDQCKTIVNEVKKRSAAKGQPRDYTDELKGDINKLKSLMNNGLKEIANGADGKKAASIASNCESTLWAVNKKYMDTLAKKWNIK